MFPSVNPMCHGSAVNLSRGSQAQTCLWPYHNPTYILKLSTIIWYLRSGRAESDWLTHSPLGTAPVSGCLWWRRDTPCLLSCGHSVCISNLQQRNTNTGVSVYKYIMLDLNEIKSRNRSESHDFRDSSLPTIMLRPCTLSPHSNSSVAIETDHNIPRQN